MSSQNTLTGKAGGRKAMGFYAALGCSFVLALSGKATGEVLGLIDTLYLVFAGANVYAKKVSPNGATLETQTQPKEAESTTPTNTQTALEKP